MKLLLMRHPVISGTSEKCIGQTDVAADDFTLPSSCIKNIQRFNIEKIISSDLQRCTVLAGRVADLLNMEYTVSPMIREYNFGDERWFEDIENISPPQGESLFEFESRITEYLLELDSINTLFITHAGVIRSVLSGIKNISYKDALNIQVNYLGITGIEWNTCYADSRLLSVNL